MKDIAELIDKCISSLPWSNTFRSENGDFSILFLVRYSDWRPLQVSWWKQKEAYLIGGDARGNFFLRHCDGSVRYWDHELQIDAIIAPSVREFLSKLV